MTDWGVPDWLDAGAYPAPDSLTITQWWWEFTRRRPDYRDAWSAAPALQGQDYRFADDVDAFRLRFELSVIHDPCRGASDWELMHWRYPVDAGHLSRDISDKRDRRDLHRTYGYLFDLTRPLGPQLDQARQLVGRIQSELYPDVASRRNRRENWPGFLRVLDARDAKATFQQIADAIHPDPGSAPEPGWARDKHEAALKLRNNFPF